MRKRLRHSILEELYNIYFKTGQGKKTNSYTKFNDIETRLAYEYLLSKGLIAEKNEGGNNFRYKITAIGIDVIEDSIQMPGL